MKIKFLNTIFTGVILLVSCLVNFANATLVTETQLQTINFQDFTFNLNIDDWVSDSESTLLLEVKGDFNITTEYFELFVEGEDQGRWRRNNSSDSVVYVGNTVKLMNQFTFNATDSSTFLADNILSFNVNFSDQVHMRWGEEDGTPAYVKATYSYNATDVPEPSTFAVFALGMLGLISGRVKKQA